MPDFVNQRLPRADSLSSISVHKKPGSITPSTDCSEDEVILNWELDTKLRQQSQETEAAELQTENDVRRNPRGLSQEQFLRAVRPIFLFPSVAGNAKTSAVPVCIICQNRMQTGESCRELVVCGHCFHAECIESFFQSHSRCPVCRARCRPPASVRGRAKRLAFRYRARPFWTPEYDAELLGISDRVDRERRARVYLTKGVRDDVPQSQVFLKSSLPVVLEECHDELRRDDGSLLSLCRFLHREKEKQVLSSIKNWNRDMQKLAIAFVLSVVVMYLSQKHYVETYLKLCLRAPKKE
jgi:hypothetical protein